jgi:hypothetical protein
MDYYKVNILSRLRSSLCTLFGHVDHWNRKLADEEDVEKFNSLFSLRGDLIRDRILPTVRQIDEALEEESKAFLVGIVGKRVDIHDRLILSCASIDPTNYPFVDLRLNFPPVTADDDRGVLYISVLPYQLIGLSHPMSGVNVCFGSILEPVGPFKKAVVFPATFCDTNRATSVVLRPELLTRGKSDFQRINKDE